MTFSFFFYQLLRVANEATDHVGGLHKKLDRKVKIESENDVVMQKFRAGIREDLLKIGEQVTNFNQQQVKFCQDLNSSFGKANEISVRLFWLG